MCVCVCGGGGGGEGCNIPAEIVSKNFLPPAEYTLKIAPLEERDTQSCLR